MSEYSAQPPFGTRRLFWRWKSRPNPVRRPRLDAELRDLIRRMARENPTWGRRRIRAELALLGYAVAELTVATAGTGGAGCYGTTISRGLCSTMG